MFKTRNSRSSLVSFVYPLTTRYDPARRQRASNKSASGSQKSKMAALKIQLRKSRRIHMIATKFQRFHLCFRDQAARKDY